MSKLTDIKYRIDQLDGGTFQNLCDSYLSYRGYKNPYSFGMNTGTNKTATGNPDTYFLTEDNRYILVMYTTQKTNFLNKAVEDFDKCFDSEKTGVSPESVAEIIYCHTYGRLRPGDDQYLRNYCETHGAKLELIGLDQLANDIFSKYPFLAQDFLNISISSGQIMPLDVFVARHDANKMAAPLETDFLFREKEVEEAINDLNSSDVLLIAGPAGVGKTRFALEVCRQLSERVGYEVLVIKSNDLQLYDDLVTSIESDKNYLVFVDDANELSGLRYVLDYLPKNPGTTKHISKLILTVRDYARKLVMDRVLNVASPKILKINTFDDTDIRKLMKSYYGIANPLFLDQIVAIAEGNARLAMLAGKIALDSDSLGSIRDASELYQNYYHEQLNTLICTETGIYSAGIIAFIQSVHLDYLEKLNPIFEIIGITSDEFKSDLKLLHEAEIVDLFNDTAARISDQSFGNFLIKHVFVEKKLIPLGSMIETCFYISEARAIDACNVLLNVFSEGSVIEYIESQIKQLWNKLESNQEIFPAFFKAFHMICPTETLILLQKKIDQEAAHSFDILEFFSKNKRQNSAISDEIIQMLGDFKYSDELPLSVELLLSYYKKRPDLFQDFYSVFAEKFQVDLHSKHTQYRTQSIVIDFLCEAVEQSPADINMLGLFVRVAGIYLQFDFSKIASGRHHSMTIYNFALEADRPVLEYRKKLLLHLQIIYKSGKMNSEIAHILNDYGVAQHGSDVNYDIIREEFAEVLHFFALFQPNDLYACVVASHIKKISVIIDYPLMKQLSPFLNSKKYEVFSTLSRDLTDICSGKYEEGMQRHKARVEQLVKDYNEKDIDYLIEICSESFNCFKEREHNLTSGILYVFNSISDRNELYLYLTSAYIKANTPYNVPADAIIQRLFEIVPVDDVKKIITECPYSQRNVWLWHFFTMLPEQQITRHWAEELLKYFDTPDFELKSSPYRNIGLISKYKKVEPQILFEALRLICKHYDESPFVFDLYTYDILNHDAQDKAIEFVNEFSHSGNLPLLEEVYLKGAVHSKGNDCSGTLLFAILAIDPKFLYSVLDSMTDDTGMFTYYDRYDTDRLSMIWDTENSIELADQIFDYLHSKSEKTGRWLYQPILSLIFAIKEDRQDFSEKQDYWIAHAIECYSKDSKRMYELFSAIENLSVSRKKKAVDKFLSLSADPEVFNKLPLTQNDSGSWSVWESEISHMNSQIEFLESLLPSVSQLKYLRQKQHIEQEIETLKKRIRSREVIEMLEEWYR